MKFRFQGLLSHGTVVFLFLALSAFFLLLTSTEADRHLNYRVFRAERLGEEILRSIRDGMIAEDAELPESVEGFGFYTPAGFPLVALGTVPSTLDPEYFPPESSPRWIQGDGDAVFFIKTLSPPRLSTRPPFGFPQPPGGRSDPVQGFVLVHLLDTQGRTYPLVLWSIYGILQLGLGLGGFLVWRLQNRNRDLARQLREQEETAFLGDAGAVLAHEIKTPLSTILLQARLLSGTEEAREAAEAIAQEASRISRLVERVRDLVRDPRGHPEILDLRGFLTQAGLESVEIDPGSTPALVFMDPWRLRSVLENLIQNALESQEPGTPHPVLRTASGEKLTQLEVLDRGKGVMEEHRPRLFTPFHTTKSQGTGLGLALVRRFMEGAGGTVELLSRPGGGTIARLSWPLPKGETHDTASG